MRGDWRIEQPSLTGFKCEVSTQAGKPTEAVESRLIIDKLGFTEVEVLPDFNNIEYGELFSLKLTNNTSSYTHGLHRFAAKYVPQLPRWALEQFCEKGSCVVDPFMGSGTTLVEALMREVTAIGFDIDPLAHLISHAKTDVPSSVRISDLGMQIHERWDGPATSLTTPMPDVKNFGHWYSQDAWAKLQTLLQCIHFLECEDDERRFLLAVFSSILRRVSNADDQSQKTYVSGTNHKKPPEVMETFWQSFRRALRGLKDLEFVKAPTAQVVVKEKGEATSLGLAAGTVDLFITSPPYLDSVDYMYNFMLEYFWLGPSLGVKDRKALNSLRRRQLGAKSPDQVPDFLPAVLGDLIDLEHIPSARRGATSAYFHNMYKHFAEAADAMRLGARYVLVIGNSQTRTGVVPVHDCLVRLAATVGLELENAFAYRVRRHYMKFPRKGRGGIILMDWIIVLRKVNQPVLAPARLPLMWTTLGEHSVAN